MENIFNKLAEKAVHAMVSAIQVYNNPTSVYRAETFSILAVNGWELLLKAIWLKGHDDDLSSLYVPDGRNGEQVKLSRSGSPLTEEIMSLAGKLRGQGVLDKNTYQNLEGLIEIRDVAIHFYNESGRFEIRVHETASATVHNFASLTKEWFALDISEKYHFALMPLSFVNIAQPEDTVLSGEVKNLVEFLDGLIGDSDKSDTEHFVAIPIEVNLTQKSKSATTPEFRRSNSPDAIPVKKVVAEKDIRELYPWEYADLVKKCREEDSGFKLTPEFHRIRKEIAKDPNLAHTRFLNPGNSRSGTKTFYSPNILQKILRKLGDEEPNANPD